VQVLPLAMLRRAHLSGLACVYTVLAMQFGSGVQIFATCIVTLVLASAGFLSPASRGALLTSAVVLFPLLAVTSGFSAVLLWINTNNSFEGWTSICLQTACYVPGADFLCPFPLTPLSVLFVPGCLSIKTESLRLYARHPLGVASFLFPQVCMHRVGLSTKPPLTATQTASLLADIIVLARSVLILQIA
jgi:hypothetical protein